MICISEDWEGLAAALLESDLSESIYIVGATDTGKTTLCRHLLGKAAAETRTACVDCERGSPG